MAIPTTIKKEHIDEAMKFIDEHGIPEKYKSKHYDVIENNSAYPPKYLLHIAAK